MGKQIISISGRMNAGKDSIGLVCQYLIHCDRHGPIPFEDFKLHNDKGVYSHNWQIKKFADKLKDMVCMFLGCTRAQLEDRDFKEKELGSEWWYWETKDGNLYDYHTFKLLWDQSSLKLVKMTPRLLLQKLGTEGGRKILHPSIWINALFSDFDKDSNWIITDTRFLNEIQRVEQYNGIKIHIYDPNLEINPQEEHESERALDAYNKWDYIIPKQDTIEDLIPIVRELLIKEEIID